MSTQSLLNRLFTVAALASTALLILTALPLASTSAARPPESLTALNRTEASEGSALLNRFNAPSVASVVQSLDPLISAALHSSPVMFIENVGQFADGARFQVRGRLSTPSPAWVGPARQPRLTLVVSQA